MATNMGYEETFELNGDQIKTTVTYDKVKIDEHISSFLRPSINHQTKVIGFDAEWFLSYTAKKGSISQSKCATVQLCDGHSCLIIQLYRRHKPHGDCPTILDFEALGSMVNFLSMPDYTFVGVGIKKNLAKLEKLYGIGCRNSVELGALAATVMFDPLLSYGGVDELAFAVDRLDLQVHRPATVVYDYSRSPLSKELAKLATVNVYSYYKIGSKLLRRQV